MLDSYRRVLGRRGTRAFSAAGLLARLPVAMVSLGTVFLVEDATGSYAFAGTVSGTLVLAQAALAVAQGRLLDVWGQSRVLPPAVLMFCAALAALAASVEQGWPAGTTFAAAAAAGAAMPQIGASSRARWPHVLDAPDEVQTAYALEGVLDEMVFIAGPVLVTFLATAWHPVAGIATAAIAALAGTLWFAALRGTEPPAGRHTGQLSRATMPWGPVLCVVLASVSLGTLLGAAEVATVAFADEQGRPVAAGWLLALWALGSLLAGLVTGAVSWQAHPARRLLWGSLAMTAAAVPMPWVPGLASLAVVMLVGGLAIAPTLIAAASTMERVTPGTRLTEGMALLHTGLLGGVAPGAALAGYVVDHRGASAAYLVPIAAGVVAVLGARLTERAAR